MKREGRGERGRQKEGEGHTHVDRTNPQNSLVSWSVYERLGEGIKEEENMDGVLKSNQ